MVLKSINFYNKSTFFVLLIIYHKINRCSVVDKVGLTSIKPACLPDYIAQHDLLGDIVLRILWLLKKIFQSRIDDIF